MCWGEAPLTANAHMCSSVTKSYSNGKNEGILQVRLDIAGPIERGATKALMVHQRFADRR